MTIGVATMILHLPEARSLKEKRSILQSLIRKMQNKFNAAVSEVEDQNLWQRATLGVAVIGGDSAHASSQLQAIIRFVESEPSVVMADVRTEIL